MGISTATLKSYLIIILLSGLCFFSIRQIQSLLNKSDVSCSNSANVDNMEGVIWAKHIDLESDKPFDVSGNYLALSHTDCDVVLVYNLLTGQTIWSAEIERPTALVIVTDTIYVSSGGNHRHITALDLLTGTTFWESEKYIRSSLTPLAAIEDTLLVNQQNNLLAFSIKTGQLEARQPIYPLNQNIYSNGFIWCLCDGNLKAIDPFSGEVQVSLEEERLPTCCLRDLLVESDIAIALFTNSILAAFDLTTGQLLWIREENSWVSNLISSEDSIYFLNQQETLEQRNLLTGKGETFFDPITIDETTPKNCTWDSSSICGSWLVGNKDIGVIYLQDSNQLIAISLSPH